MFLRDFKSEMNGNEFVTEPKRFTKGDIVCPYLGVN